MLPFTQTGRQSNARGESSFGQGRLTINVPQQQKVTRPRPCRATLCVDVSASMEELIDPVISGIENVNSVLNDGDLVSVRYFATSVRTAFPYIDREKVNWTKLGNNLRSIVTDPNQWQYTDGTALWDAIVQVIRETPRDAKFHPFKPETIIFTDGEENCSQNTFKDVQACLEKPGIGYAHITIIDASARGNLALESICGPIEHCSYHRVEASQEAIKRVFQTTMTQINTRLEVPLDLNAELLQNAFSAINIRLAAGAHPSNVAEGGVRMGNGRNVQGNREQNEGNSNNRNSNNRTRGKSPARNQGNVHSSGRNNHVVEQTRGDNIRGRGNTQSGGNNNNNANGHNRGRSKSRARNQEEARNNNGGKARAREQTPGDSIRGRGNTQGGSNNNNNSRGRSKSRVRFQEENDYMPHTNGGNNQGHEGNNRRGGRNNQQTEINNWRSGGNAQGKGGSSQKSGGSSQGKGGSGQKSGGNAQGRGGGGEGVKATTWRRSDNNDGHGSSSGGYRGN